MSKRKKKNNNPILIMENHFVDLPLRRFSASEIDILMAICYKCQNEEINEVKFSFDELSELSGYKTKDKKQFIKKLYETNRKLIELHITLTSEDQKIIKQFVLFSDFETDGERNELRVKVHEPFAFLLNRLTDNFTKLELAISSSFKTTYSKQIYKKLRQFKNQSEPFWQVSLGEFKEYLDIPDSYKISIIDQKVIKPSIKELSPVFKNLECKKIYEQNTGNKGRPSVVGYRFQYTNLTERKDVVELEKPINLQPNPEMDALAEKNGYKKIGTFCPKCHKEVYLKYLKNKWGEYALIGHPNFKTGGCNWTSTSFTDALTRDRVEVLEEIANAPEEEVLPPEELQEKIKALIKNLDVNEQLK